MGTPEGEAHAAAFIRHSPVRNCAPGGATKVANLMCNCTSENPLGRITCR